MKTIVILLITLLLSSSLFAKKVVKGYSNTSLDDYRVEKMDDNKYELTYSNSNEKFTIEVCPDKAKCCYLVRGKQVEVMYVCNELGFGLRKMPAELQSMPTAQYKNLVDNKSFRYQSLLSPNHKNPRKAVGIIACFFPEVIDDSAKQLVFNAQPLENLTAEVKLH